MSNTCLEIEATSATRSSVLFDVSHSSSNPKCSVFHYLEYQIQTMSQLKTKCLSISVSSVISRRPLLSSHPVACRQSISSREQTKMAVVASGTAQQSKVKAAPAQHAGVSLTRLL